VRVSKLFKPSALKLLLADSATPVVSQSHADIWRTETILHIVIYFWLYVAEQPNSFLLQRQVCFIRDIVGVDTVAGFHVLFKF